MSKKIQIFAFALVFVLKLVVITGADNITIEKGLSLNPPESRDACSMYKTNGVYGQSAPLEGTEHVVTFFDPATFCTAPIYPFEITAFSFSLDNITTPVQIDVVVWSMADPQDFCQGPGILLHSVSVVCDEFTFGYPNVGTVDMSYCVEEPFFIGIVCNSFSAASIVLDNQSPVTCDNWVGIDIFGSWLWWDFPSYWGVFDGYPFFYVDGETNSSCQDIPTLNEWGLIILALLILAAGTTAIVRRRRAAEVREM